MNINRAKNGHVKLWIKINDSDLAQDNAAYIVFIRMLFFAHFEDNFTSIRFNGKQYKLKAGEFSASMGELSALVNVPVSTLRKVIDRLVEDKRVSKRTDRQTTIFSICNWSLYQGDQRKRLANARANDRANEVANDIANVTEGKKNIKNIKNINIGLLNVLNEVKGRSFKVLPKSSNETLKSFTVEEIEKALIKMVRDPWHAPKVSELSSEYMLRVSTIDKFHSAKSVAQKSVERLGTVDKSKMSLSKKELNKLEYT